jgi:hypothetical protein
MGWRNAGAWVAIAAVLAGALDRPRAAAAAAARPADPPPIFVAGRLVREPSVVVGRHLLVPVRGVFEALHASVIYTPPRIVVVRKNETVLAGLVVGRQHAIVKNRARLLAAAPIRVGSRIYVPLRFVAEIAGGTVTYSSHPRLVDIRVPSDELADTFGAPEPGPPADNGTPLWALIVVGISILSVAAEAVRSIVVGLRTRRRRNQLVLRNGGRAPLQLTDSARLRHEHHIGNIVKQTAVDDAVNRA